MTDGKPKYISLLGLFGLGGMPDKALSVTKSGHNGTQISMQANQP